MGYEVQVEKCSSCGCDVYQGKNFYFHFGKGLICGKCKEQAVDIYRINMELLRYLKCLKDNTLTNKFDNSEPQRAIAFLEKYAKYHVQGFKGIQSIKSFN